MNTRSHSFWDKHAKHYKTTFEDILEVARYIERTEYKHVFSVVKTSPQMEILDLGCGFGRWTFEFAKRCRRVVAVDFSAEMAARARQNAKHFGFANVEFHVVPIQQFRSSEKFDIVMISAVLVNVQDNDFSTVLAIAKDQLKPGGRIVLREIVVKSRNTRYEIHEKFGDIYTVIYRTPNEYFRAFERVGMNRLYVEDIAPVNFTASLYKRVVPKSLIQVFLLRKLLQLGLAVQFVVNPFLLRHKWFYRPFVTRFSERKHMLFVYGID